MACVKPSQDCRLLFCSRQQKGIRGAYTILTFVSCSRRAPPSPRIHKKQKRTLPRLFQGPRGPRRVSGGSGSRNRLGIFRFATNPTLAWNSDQPPPPCDHQNRPEPEIPAPKRSSSRSHPPETRKRNAEGDISPLFSPCLHHIRPGREGDKFARLWHTDRVSSALEGERELETLKKKKKKRFCGLRGIQ